MITEIKKEYTNGEITVDGKWDFYPINNLMNFNI
jgi:hypothetical protein